MRFNAHLPKMKIEKWLKKTCFFHFRRFLQSKADDLPFFGVLKRRDCLVFCEKRWILT